MYRCVTEWGGGSKKIQICVTSFMNDPFFEMLFQTCLFYVWNIPDLINFLVILIFCPIINLSFFAFTTSIINLFFLFQNVKYFFSTKSQSYFLKVSDFSCFSSLSCEEQWGLTIAQQTGNKSRHKVPKCLMSSRLHSCLTLQGHLAQVYLTLSGILYCAVCTL